jgi:hypothetical protein
MRILKAGTTRALMLAAVILAFPIGVAHAGDVKRSAKPAAPPATVLKAPTAPESDNGSAAATAARIDRLLTPRASDPDVPLPMRDLDQASTAEPALTRTQVYGRAEQGGGVLGLRVPFSRGSGAVAPSTRY